MAFDVYRQLVVEVVPDSDGDLVDLRTTGLATVGRPELAVRRVPAALTSEAAAILNRVAAYVANDRPVADGERLAIPHAGNAALVVRLIRDDASADAQRIVDPFEPADEVPWIALSTVLLWKARVADQRGDRDAAVSLLEQSLIHTPPAESDAPLLDHPYNWGGAIGAMTLAELDPENSQRWQREACERSPTAALDLLGDRLVDLAGVDPEALGPALRTLVETHRAMAAPRIEGPVAQFVGPLAIHQNGRLAFEVAVLPTSLAQKVLAARVWDALLDPRVIEIAAELVTQCDPFHLLHALWAVGDLYGRSPEAVLTDLVWVPGMRLGSVVLADVGRLVVGGADPGDLASYYGTVDDPAAMERVRAADAAFQAMAQESLRL